MPYSIDKPDDLPANVQKMPMAKKKKWIAVFNASLAACQKDGGDSKECEGKSFKLANGVLKKDRSTMDWLTRIFNKLIGTDGKHRAMSVDNIMSKVYALLYAMEDEKDEDGHYRYYSITRLMFDESGLWVVLNSKGSLYRAVIGVTAEGEVTLGALEAVKEEYVPVQQNRVWVKRQADGQVRFYCIAATAVLNRVNEIDSRKLFDNMVQHAEEADFYPAIDIHHLGPLSSDLFDIGYADYIARVGVTYVAAGFLDQSKELGRRMADTLEKDTEGEWGCSIEYFALGMETVELNLGDNGTIPIDVYTDGVNTRISLLPEQRAANWFTKATLKERTMKPTKDALLTLRKLFETEEEFEEFVGQLAEVNEEVEQRGLIHREADKTEGTQAGAESEQLDPEGETKVASAPAAETPIERELVVDDTMISAIADQVLAKMTAVEETPEEVERSKAVDGKLDQILAAVSALTNRLNVSEGRLEKLERSREDDHQEWVADLPPRLKERIVVTHRPTQANGNGEQLPTTDQVAANTLSKVPSLIG